MSCDAPPEPKPDPVALTPSKRSSQDLFSIAAEFTAGIGSKRDRSSRRATLDYGTSYTPRRSKPTFPTLPKTSPELRVKLIYQQWRCGRGIADCFHCPSEQVGRIRYWRELTRFSCKFLPARLALPTFQALCTRPLLSCRTSKESGRRL